MQTFLPYASFAQSAKVLDKKRLWKQVVEADQILDALLDRPTKTGKPRTGWKNHPAVIMWKGYELALAHYRNIMLTESINRAKINTSKQHIQINNNYLEFPWWLGNQQFHDSHKSNLLRKDYSFYLPLFDGFTDPSIPYIWPVSISQNTLKRNF
jgi:hypothetical protein